MKKETHKKIADEIIKLLNNKGPLESGQICVRLQFTSSAILEVLRDLVDRDIIVKEKHGTKPFIESVMLRNVYKYRVKTLP